MPELANRIGAAGLVLFVAAVTTLCVPDAWAAKAGKDTKVNTQISPLDQAENIQSEYVRANQKACDDGELSSCEAADEARYGLTTFQIARKACASGDTQACQRVDRISPLIIQGANLSCETVKLQSCPGSEVVTQSDSSTTTSVVPDDSSNAAVTNGSGVVIYNGRAVSGATSGAAPPPH